jgi:hypothetical protein
MATLNDLRNILFKTTNNFANINSFWKNHVSRDPFLKSVYMTIDLVLGDGSRHSYATDLVTVTDKDGYILAYEPGLQEEPTITTQYSLGEGQPSQRNFTLTIDGRKINALNILKSGNFISGISEVSLQVQNGIYENRLILIRGETSSSINFGVKEEMIELQISDIDLSKDRIVPEFVINNEDFIALPDGFQGYRYPVFKDQCNCGIPCIRTSNFEWGAVFIIGYGHNIGVKEVLLNGISVPASDMQRGWSIIKSVSSSGVPYTGIEFVFPTDTVENIFGDYQTAGEPWSSSDTVYAKTYSLNGNNRSLLQIIRELLITNTSLGLDIIDEDLFSKSQSKTPYLKAEFLINASGSNATKAIEYIQSTVCTSFPMLSMVYSDRGVGPVITDRRFSRLAQHFIVGNSEILDRSTGITEKSKSELYNSFTLRYAYDAANDSFTKTIVRNSNNSLLCEVSENRIGKKDYDIIDSIIIQDDSTAQYVVEWLSDHYSLPSYYIEYECVPSILFRLKIGDNVSITDDELSFDKEVATIEKLEYSKGKITLGLRFWILYKSLSKSS